MLENASNRLLCSCFSACMVPVKSVIVPNAATTNPHCASGKRLCASVGVSQRK